MFRLVRNDTIRKALQQTLSVRRFTQVKSAKNSNTQVYLSTLFKRSLSSTVAKKSNDAVFLAASVGVAGVVGTVLYYTTSSTSAKKSVIISKQEEVEEEEPLVDEVDEIEKDRNEFLKAAVANLPESSPYVIIGAGTTAHAACRAIRTNQPDAKILIIGEEDVLPYMRPPLSKELWFSDSPDAAEKLIFKSWNGKERSVFFEEESYYTPLEEFITKEDGAVSVVSGKKVLSIDAEDHKIQLSSGQSLTYQKLLIATGGTPRNHPAFAETDSNVSRRTTLFRNVSDFRKLDKVLKNKEHVTVVGGGFLGSELACALAAHGKRSGLNVTQVYPEDGNMAKVLPRYLSEWTTKKVNKEGVEIISQQNIKTAKASGKKVELEFINGEKLMTDHVVVCVGLEPNVELSKSAGLEIDPEVGGFRVNSELEARSDIWVAGDAACFFDINLGRRRVEHHDHAVVSGRLAGENMTGAKKSYKHQSMFWSDLGPEVGYEAIGLVDSSLPTVGVWAKASATDTPKAAEEATGESIPSERPDENALAETSSSAESETESQPTGDAEEFGKGVVFYMKEKRIVGILLWNIFSKMPIARKIITEGKDHDNLNEVAKLFHIHK